MVIHLGETKMAVRNAGTESTSFRDLKLSLMLQAWKIVHPPDALLIEMSPHVFDSGLREGLKSPAFPPGPTNHTV